MRHVVDSAGLTEIETAEMHEALGVIAGATSVDVMVTSGGVQRIAPGSWLKKLVAEADEAGGSAGDGAP